MNLVLIDNSFYKLTPQQASQLSIEHRLPRAGYEIKADPAKLASVKFGRMNRTEQSLKGKPKFQNFDHCTPDKIETAWIKTTPLSYWQGEPHTPGWTWALQVNWKRS